MSLSLYAEQEKSLVLTLSLLEPLKKHITVIYIVPDPFMLSKTQKLQHNVVFRVLQEYARSGLFESTCTLYLIKTLNLFVGASSISDMYEKINSMVANFIVSLHWFKNTEPVIGSIHEPKDISRIRTISIQ